MIVHFLLKSGAILAIFFLLFYLLFRRTTFIRLNRLVLLLGLILSMTIPLLTIPISFQPGDTIPSFTIGNKIFLENSVSNAFGDSGSGNDHFRIAPWLTLFYWCGVALLFLRLITSLISVAKILQGSLKRNQYGTSFYITKKSKVAFSFFNTIIIPECMISRAVVIHEKGHVRNYHWFDLLLIELITICQWFNPFIYLYRNALRQIHEYEADKWVVSDGVSLPQYLDAIVANLVAENRNSFTSAFSSHSIKSRIDMLTKNKTSMKKSFFYLLLLPISSIMLYAFADKAGDMPARNFTIVVDPAHGGTDAGATTADGWTEKQFTLALATKVKALGAKRGITVVLTREQDETVSLQDRVRVAQTGSSIGFISLHAGGSEESSGATIFVNKESNKLQQSEKLAGSVMASLEKINGLKLNSINYSSAFLLRENTAPAIILEIGNLSGAQGVDFMKDAENQERIAESVLEAIVRFGNQ